MHAPRDCQGWGVPFPSKTKKNQAKYEIQTINKANQAIRVLRKSNTGKYKPNYHY